MPKVTLISGAYESRAMIANAQRCVNLYPERNTQDADFPFTHYTTPGLVPIVEGLNPAPVRCLYTATNGHLYAVVGDKVWHIDQDFVPTELGKIGPELTPVRMRDNGTEIGLVDGTKNLYKIELGSNIFAKLNDPNYYASSWIDYLDTYLLFSRVGTNQWFTTLSNTLQMDPLYIVAKTGGPDPVVAAVVNRDEIWVIGEKTTEVWTNVGAAEFPFQRLAGVFVEHGCAARYSIAAWDKSIFWLSQDKNGRARVSMVVPYDLGDVSTYSIEQELAKYKRLDDAVGFVYQQQGHVFYQLTFPTDGKTWVYDVKEKLWHERVSIDEDGNWHRHRANCAAYAYGKNLVGDFRNGIIYELRTDVHTDNGLAVPRLRSFPHLVNNGKRVTYDAFMANMETGTVGDEWPMDPGADPDPLLGPWVSLRWSDTRGKTWGNAVQQSLGRLGQYDVLPIWRQLGMARDRVFELSWSAPGETALNGAWIEFTPSDT